MAEWIKKPKTKNQEHTICCLQETHFRAKHTHRRKVRERNKIFHANENNKKAGLQILISDKADFKTKSIKTTKKCII